jgi:hypothetical protein
LHGVVSHVVDRDLHFAFARNCYLPSKSHRVRNLVDIAARYKWLVVEELRRRHSGQYADDCHRGHQFHKCESGAARGDSQLVHVK